MICISSLEVRPMLHFLVSPQRLLVFDTLQRAPEVRVLDDPMVSMSGGEAGEMVLVLLLQPPE